VFKILICEQSLSEIAQQSLVGYSFDIAYNTQDVINKTFECSYDLFIFHLECFDVLEELKNSIDIPATIFVDEYYNLQNFQKALSLGDAYILKPLYIEELKIRISYYFRKSANQRHKIIKYKDFYFHTHIKQLFHKKNKIKLTPNELKLVEIFITHQNKPISKDIIFEKLESSSDGSLRVFIHKLNKIGLDIKYDRSILSYMLVN